MKKTFIRELTKICMAAVCTLLFSTAVSAAPASIEDAILDGIKAAKNKIDVSAYKIDAQAAMKTYLNVVSDNPDIFYVDETAVTCTYDKASGICTEIVCSYNASDIAARKKKFDAAVDLAVQEAKTQKNKYDQAKAVHDYMVKTFDFDVTCKNTTAYDLAVNKKGTCTSYTGFYKAAMDKLGIPCKVAVSSDIQHEWNVIQIDGNWYHADITYDDPVGVDSMTYANFMKSDKIMGITGHINWKITGGIKCTDTKYNSLS